MATFVRATRRNGREVLINMANVLWMQRLDDGTTQIRFSADDSDARLRVRESLEELADRAEPRE